jgi:hypothetical protein
LAHWGESMAIRGSEMRLPLVWRRQDSRDYDRGRQSWQGCTLRFGVTLNKTLILSEPISSSLK